jgi:serine/threonine protein kinase
MLDDASAKEVQSHLESCPDCRKNAAALSGDDSSGRLRAAEGQGTTVPFNVPGVPPELAASRQYQVIRELGRGGMGVVYLAKNLRMDRMEVLKVVSKDLLDKPGAAERFLREIRSAAKLSHDNVVKAYSSPEVGDLLLFAMEYVEGEDLAKVVKEHGPLPVPNACFYAHQAAQGLQHAFEHGMVHRDIKPHNLILSRQGKKHVVKILDFGLAKATREKGTEHELTGAGKMLGTPDYIAPEQTLDAASADIRADMYSLGCTLYYLLAGAPPFKGKSLFEILQAHISTEAKPLNEVRPEVPAELAAVVAKMMAKEAGQRYQKPIEVAQALAPFIKAGAVGRTSSPSTNLATKPTAPTSPARQETLLEGSMTATETRSRSRTSPQMEMEGPPVAKPPVKKWLIGAGVAGGVLVLGLVGLWAAGIFKGSAKDGNTKDEKTTQDKSPSDNGEPPRATEGFVSLFNGKNLTGWKVEHGDPKLWEAANGEIIAWGKDPKTRNYLLTERAYANFRLGLEFNLAKGASCSIILRGLWGEKLPWNGQPLANHPEFKLFRSGGGEQTGTTHWVRNAIAVAPSQSAEMRPPGEWNRLEIELKGHSLRAWVNDKQIVSDTLAADARLPDGTIPALNRSAGRIGLYQYSGVVRFRKIEVKELPADEVQRPAGRFEASILEKDRGKWRVVDGCLEQTSLTDNVLMTFGDKTWRDYDMSVEFLRLRGDDQVCLAFGVDFDKRQMGAFGLSSFRNSAHTLEWFTNGKLPPKPQRQMRASLPAGGWHKARLNIRGRHVQCFLDDRKLVECDVDLDLTGRAGLRTWNSIYRFRNIKVTAPNGKALLEGLPDVDPPWPGK